MVSIIVPIYNGKKYIKDALESCINQTYENIEIIVIDDGSTDGLVLNDINRIDTSIQFHQKKNEGLGMTRNLGMILAKGKYIFFLDADDTLPINTIEILQKYIKGNDFAIGQCKRVYLDENKKIYKKNIWKKDLYKKEPNKYNLIIDTIATNKLYKKEFLMQNNIMFLTGLYEDKLFVLKLFELSKKFIFIKKVVYHWQIHYKSTSITNSLDIENLIARMKVNDLCLAYTSDKKLKHTLIHNIIKHDFKVYINKVLTYNSQEIEKLYNILKIFIQTYDQYIEPNDYFVNKIILLEIDNKKLIIDEFHSIAKENNTKNIFIKIKKYFRYTFYALQVKVI